MRFPYIVKHNSTWYPAGADVPVGEPAPAVAEVVEAEPAEAPKVTKSEVQQMRKAQLLELAEKLGLEADEETTNNELKSAIIKQLNL